MRSESIFVEVVLPSHLHPIIIGSVYCTPNDKQQWALLRSTMIAATNYSRNNNIELIIFGDINARHSSFGDQFIGLNSSSSTIHPRGTNLVALADDLNLSIMNSLLCYGRATYHRSQSILDLVISSNPSLIATLTPDNSIDLVSDHTPLRGSFSKPKQQSSSPPPHPTNNRQHGNLSSSSPKLQFRNMNIELFKSTIEPAFQSFLTDPLVINTFTSSYSSSSSANDAIEWLCHSITRIFEAAATHSTPRLPNRRNINNWWTAVPGVKESLTNYHKARNRYRKHRDDEQLQQQYLTARSQWRAKARAAKASSWNDYCSKITNPTNKKLMWSAYHRTIASSFAAITSIRNDDKQPLPTSPKESLNRLTSYFADVCSSSIDNSQHESMINDFVNEKLSTRFNHSHTPPSSPPPSPPSSPPSSPSSTSSASSSLDRNFTVNDIKAAANHQKLQTALGPDGFSPYFIKHCTPSAFHALTALLNFSWRHGVLPRSWRAANITPLLKDSLNPHHLPSSYRPISLTSILIRFFERIIHRRLYPIIAPHLSRQQSGFRPGYSTLTHLHRLQHVITSSFERKQHRSIAFLDISKAFDATWHNGLLYKLSKHFNINGRAWLWMAAFLSNRQIRVVSDGYEADWRYITAGVPQGSVLAPLLFLIYINDMDEERLECELLLYADDIGIYGLKDGIEGDDQLRAALPNLLLWCRLWKLIFNLTKSASVCFHRLRNHRTPLPFDIQPKNLLKIQTGRYKRTAKQRAPLLLPQLDSYKYLGLLFDFRLKWDLHCDYIKRKISKSNHFIMRIVPPSPLSSSSAHPASSSSRSPPPSSSVINSGPSFSIIRQLVHSITRSQLCYGFPIWSPPTEQHWSQLQSIFIRPFLRSLALPTSTHQLSLLVESASSSLHCIYDSYVLCFILKLNQLPPHHPSHELFLEQATTMSQLPPSSNPPRGSLLFALRQLPQNLSRLLPDGDSLLPFHLAREFTFLHWHATSASGLDPRFNFPTRPALPTTSSRPNTIYPASASSPPSSSLSPTNSPSLSSSSSNPPLLRHLPGSSLHPYRPLDSVRPSLYLLHDPLATARLRARLRLGRARLGSSLHRRGLTPSPLCPHPPCTDDNLHETAAHVFLYCPRFDPLRVIINHNLRSHQSLQRELSIDDVMGAVEGEPARKFLLQQSATLIHHIDSIIHF